MLSRAVVAALAEARALDAEVLVVDNASTDDTPAVLRALQNDAGGRLRVVEEQTLGLSAARNCGLDAAEGGVVAYLDDDAVPRGGWLAALLAPYADPRVVGVGGRVIVRFETPPPAWLTPAFHGGLSGYDLGDEPQRLRHHGGDWFPTGANISFRKTAARAAGGFCRLLGPVGRRPVMHDETDLCTWPASPTTDAGRRRFLPGSPCTAMIRVSNPSSSASSATSSAASSPRLRAAAEPGRTLVETVVDGERGQSPSKR